MKGKCGQTERERIEKEKKIVQLWKRWVNGLVEFAYVEARGTSESCKEGLVCNGGNQIERERENSKEKAKEVNRVAFMASV